RAEWTVGGAAQLRAIAARFAAVVGGRDVFAGSNDVDHLPRRSYGPNRIRITIRTAAGERTRQIVGATIVGDRPHGQNVVTGGGRWYLIRSHAAVAGCGDKQRVRIRVRESVEHLGNLIGAGRAEQADAAGPARIDHVGCTDAPGRGNTGAERSAI